MNQTARMVDRDQGEPSGDPELTHRLATAADADAIARIFSRAYRLLTFLPERHTSEADRAFIANRIMPMCDVAVAEHAGEIVSFLAREKNLIRLLFTTPNFIGRGAGGLLLNVVKNAGATALELWCFQANTGARRFFEARCFRPVEFTDGKNNEEKVPDVRYRWERAPVRKTAAKAEMTLSDVEEFHQQMQALGIHIWLDGGWGVDALLERQTRRHGDLDIVVRSEDLDAVVRFLEDRGFREAPRLDARPWNFVLGNDAGKEIDLHVIVFDSEGNGLYGPPQRGEGAYPAEALGWAGTIAGKQVRCISPTFQIQSHTGYALKEKDHKDVTALAEKFGLTAPPK